MGGFRRDSRYYSCSSCANCVLCNSRLYYSAAGTSNCWDNNIDYCSSRGSMAICKIPFTLAENFVLLSNKPHLRTELISNEYTYRMVSPPTRQNTLLAELLYSFFHMTYATATCFHWQIDD